MVQYKQGYVVTVRQNGKTVKEVEGQTPIPFNSEFELRLINKTRKRSVADVYIDGRKAAEGIVVSANGYVDLERFVKDLDRGQRFKFVPLADGRVDQGAPENGKIEVTFYPEKEAPKVETIIHEVYDHHGIYSHQCWRHHCNWCYVCHTHHDGSCHKYHTNTGGAIYASFTASGGGSVSSLSSGSTPTPDMSLLRMCSAGEAGATVEGSVSNQSFRSVSVEVDRSAGVTITLQLVGTPEQRSACNNVVPVAANVLTHHNFCPQCGTKRDLIIADFCGDCGTSLKKA